MTSPRDDQARILGARAKHFLDSGNPMPALALLREAKRLSTDPSWAWLLIGDAARQFGEPDRALACYDRVITVASRIQEGILARARALATVGRWEEAATEEAQATSYPPFDQLAIPWWDGTTTEHLAIMFTGSISSAFFFARWLPWARGRCRQLTILVAPELVAFFESQLLGCNVVAMTGASQLPRLPSAAITAMQSAHRLPAMFAPHPTHELPSPPYLHPGQPFREIEGGLKVGIVWAGSRGHPADACRSSPLEAWAPVFGVSGATFYGLQVGRLAPGTAPLHDLGPELTSWERTAAAIAQLDLVIAVDTGVVHLAGAMGRPVWVLLPALAEALWMLDRTDSPFYPTARLFRQRRVGEWPALFKEVATALQELVIESGRRSA
jgi:glycosyl transferase family 9 (putative heptosyltransferase)